jgi:prepilin-type N-terminal cleavage/methylation domain-containing protein
MMTRQHTMTDQRDTARAGTRSTNHMAGFSLIELCVVLAISVVLAAFAIPEVMSTMYSSRLRGAAAQFASLVQQARNTAEQKNVTVPVFTGTVQGGSVGVFIACSTASCPSGGNGTTYQTGDPFVPYGGGVTNGATNNAPSGLNPGFAPAVGTLYFSPRGVTVTAPGGFGLANGFVFYLTDTRNDWAAVSVSTIGRTKVWMWNGTNWN